MESWGRGQLLPGWRLRVRGRSCGRGRWSPSRRVQPCSAPGAFHCARPPAPGTQASVRCREPLINSKPWGPLTLSRWPLGNKTCWRRVRSHGKRQTKQESRSSSCSRPSPPEFGGQKGRLHALQTTVLFQNSSQEAGLGTRQRKDPDNFCFQVRGSLRKVVPDS